MRFKNTWILLVIAALFIGYFFLVEQPEHKSKIEKEELSKKLTTIEKATIKHVSINQLHAKPMRFDKQNGSWTVTAPVSDSADDSNINVLVNSIIDAEIERRITPGEEALTGTGLDSTAAMVKLETSQRDTSLALRIGAHNLTKSHFYSSVDTSSEVLLLPAIIRRYAMKELSEFRNKKVIEFPVAEVRRLELSSRKYRMLWNKDIFDEWFTVQDGDTIRGDKDALDAIIRRVAALRVNEFVSDNPDEFDAYSQGRTQEISLWHGNGFSKQTLMLANDSTRSCYALLEGTSRIVSVDKSILDEFEKEVSELRNKKLLNFNRANIIKITIITPDTTASIEKSGTEWTFPNPAMGSIEQYKVGSFLTALEQLKFEKVLNEKLADPGSHGIDQPAYRISLSGPDGKILDEFKAAFKPGEDSGFVTSLSSPLLATIEQESIDKVIDTFKQLRK